MNSKEDNETFVCPTCGQVRHRSQEVRGETVESHLFSQLRSRHPNWDGQRTCRIDLRQARVQLLRELLEAERGQTSALDEDVLARMSKSQTVARDVEETQVTWGERVADGVARFGGSWTFIGIFSFTLLGWMTGNAMLLTRPFDPYPFILLNLVLSSLAAVQAPIIMMSQNRSSQKDRERSQHDYQVNLKAELEVRLLGDKLDRMLLTELPRLMQMQELQLEMLEDLAQPDSTSQPGAPSRSDAVE